MIDPSSWTPRPAPGGATLVGRWAQLEPFNWSIHGPGLFAAVGGEINAEIWTHMPVGPFPSPDGLNAMLSANQDREGWRTMVIRSAATSEILGSASYMRIREAHGSAEIGAVAFGAKLRRTPIATDAFALMAGHVFDDLGYRRYEWKCNSQNQASKRAATRFGFEFEGVFRNDMIAKGKSRDTCWYSILDSEWPTLRAALERWLAPDNFGPDGGQIATLESFRP